MLYTDAELADFLAKCRAANHGNGQSAEIVARGPEARPKRGHATREQLRESCFKQRRRALSKSDWREDARILAEHYPEEYGEPHDLGVSSENPILPNAANAVFAAKPLSASPAPPAEGESVAIVPGSPQSAPEALPAALPIPPPSTLPNAFWRGLLFGSPDSLIGGADATIALRLVAERIGITIDQSETIPTLRAGQLRKLLRNKFGQPAG
jgi:hypothetical protein